MFVMKHLTHHIKSRLLASIRPHPSLNAAERAQAVQLASISLAMIAFVAASLTGQIAFVGSVGIAHEIVIGTVMALLIMYAFSRSRHYRIGIRFGVVASFAIAILTMLIYRSALSTVMMVSPILMLSLFYSGFVILLGTVIAIAAMLLIAPSFPADRAFLGVIVFFLALKGVVSALNALLKQHARQALERSEDRYRQIFYDNRAVKLLIEPSTGRIVDANPAAVDFYGYTLEQLQAMRIQDINTLPEEELLQELQQVLCKDRAHFEFQHRLASGEVRDVDVYSGPVTTAEGRYLFSIIVDVTGQREAEQRYRALFEQSNDAIVIMSIDGRYLQVNQRAGEMLGYAPDQLIGRPICDVIAPSEHVDNERIRERLLAGERIEPYERTMVHRDGHTFFTEVSIVVVRDHQNRPLHFQAIVRDITERKHLEEALRQSEYRFETAFHSSPVPMVISTTDPDHPVYVEVNRAYSDLVGYPREALLGQGLIETGIAVDDADRAERIRMLECQRGYDGWETRIRNHCGELRDVLISAHRMAVGELDLDIEILQDITERKQAQARALQRTLEEERERMLANFIRSISHEFRTPLAIINTSAYLLLRVDDSEKRRLYAERIEQQTMRTARLIDAMLRMVMLDNTSHVFAPIDMLAFVRRACTAVEYDLQGSRIQCDLEESLPMVLGNEQLLNEAFEALIDNAHRFADNGSRIFVSACHTGQEISLSVRDQGPGIAAEMVPHLFELFWRQDEHHTTPGVGLGLPIAQKIVHLHGGRIEVETEVGQGSIFRIVLPAIQPTDAGRP